MAEKQEFKVLFRRRWPQYIGAVSACMGGFSLGCGIGWSAPCVELLKEVHMYDISAIALIAAIFPLGAACGLPIVPFLIDKIGRKWLMLSLIPAFILGWVFIIIGVSVFALLVVGRFLTGACGGMFCVIVPMYSAEISEKQIRGTLGIFFQLLLVIGILYAYCCGYARNVVTTTGLCLVGPILFVIMMIFMPESPMFYMVKRNEEAAKKSMRFFRGPDYEEIDDELAIFKEQVEKSALQQVTFDAFMKKAVLKTLGIAYGLMFAQQFSGINAIIFYSETIFKLTGVDIDPLLQMVVFAVVQVIACVIAAALIDQVGRKVLLVISFAVMCICLIGLAVFFIIKESNPPVADTLFWLPLLCACLYILSFCLGAGPIPWAYMGEIFPTKLKGTASTSAALFNWILAFIVTVSFSSVVEAVGMAPVFFFFALICALSVVFVIFLLVETKGKTFTEIQREFGTFEIEE
ncbi:facilitated trehalose transporter Tret1-like [Apis laboriosa]|uniref:facilitated trehalose transporter Tret1-like n=1 Tax=Apis laboriosa TaxID=183418 RepID=UPI001CC5972D|nr:facilitated trehalose transporter Tret1-like [Apis laboriosa]XP_043789108.1 facilitated trehalose transporter Tret1-like [Apis laboriosa]XP_043789109.1 facilitated trehalose transporter Tret1-like [Apis laboriosa]XP_043789111.1 facilitated trehalose transporter Tret1-like [Apis laboriosa]